MIQNSKLQEAILNSSTLSPDYSNAFSSNYWWQHVFFKKTVQNLLLMALIITFTIIQQATTYIFEPGPYFFVDSLIN